MEKINYNKYNKQKWKEIGLLTEAQSEKTNDILSKNFTILLKYLIEDAKDYSCDIEIIAFPVLRRLVVDYNVEEFNIPYLVEWIDLSFKNRYEEYKKSLDKDVDAEAEFVAYLCDIYLDEI
jgi:hypothetical protein